MSTFWKIVIGLMVTLPVGAYVAGNLAGATAERARAARPDRDPRCAHDSTAESRRTARRPHDSGRRRQQE